MVRNLHFVPPPLFATWVLVLRLLRRSIGPGRYQRAALVVEVSALLNPIGPSRLGMTSLATRSSVLVRNPFSACTRRTGKEVKVVPWRRCKSSVLMTAKLTIVYKFEFILILKNGYISNVVRPSIVV